MLTTPARSGCSKSTSQAAMLLPPGRLRQTPRSCIDGAITGEGEGAGRRHLVASGVAAIATRLVAAAAIGVVSVLLVVVVLSLTCSDAPCREWRVQHLPIEGKYLVMRCLLDMYTLIAAEGLTLSQGGGDTDAVELHLRQGATEACCCMIVGILRRMSRGRGPCLKGHVACAQRSGGPKRTS